MSTATADSAKVIKNYARGEIIATQGSTGRGWYVLLSGRVAVFKHEAQVAEFSTRGVIFGEISSILSRPRTATLIAVEPTSVVHFDADLDDLISKHPAVAKTMLVSLAQRLQKTTDALWTAVQPKEQAPHSGAAADDHAMPPSDEKTDA
jgi:CRP-like cAMP-binding protein